MDNNKRCDSGLTDILERGGDFLCCNAMLTLLVWGSHRTEMLTVRLPVVLKCLLYQQTESNSSCQYECCLVSLVCCHCQMILNTVTPNGGQELTNCVATKSEYHISLLFC